VVSQPGTVGNALCSSENLRLLISGLAAMHDEEMSKEFFEILGIGPGEERTCEKTADILHLKRSF